MKKIYLFQQDELPDALTEDMQNNGVTVEYCQTQVSLMAGKDKIFVFDLDGTLADTAPALLNAGNQVLRSIGRNPIELEQYKGFIGGGTKNQVEKLLNYTGGIPDRGLDFYFKFFQDRYYEDPVKECYLYE